VSGETNPRFDVMTKMLSAFAANFRAYASFPRKYNPLRKLNTSPSVTSSFRSRLASPNSVAGFNRIPARLPAVLAGERTNTLSVPHCFGLEDIDTRNPRAGARDFHVHFRFGTR
jgi:hypothetical protein